MSFKLSPYERKICNAIWADGFAQSATGELPYLKPGKRAIKGIVRAEVIRRLFLAMPLDGEDKGSALRHGLHLKGIWIRGSLNLAGLNRGFDREAPPAIFENCHFEGDDPGHSELLMADIVLSEGHFAKLSFKGSRFVDLVADNVIVNGPVDLSDVSSAECFVRKGTGCRRSSSETAFEYPLVPAGEAEEGAEPKGRKLPRCAANFAGARIQGDFTASRATLCVLPKVKGFDAAAGKRPYALKLSGSRISGSVVLQPEFSAHGGVAIAQAHVDETIWMQGIRCSAEWSDTALDFGYTKCGGIISIRSCDRLQSNGSPGCDRVLCHGMINFYGAETVGEVHMGGGRHTLPSLESRPTSQSISFFQAKIGGLIRLTQDDEHVPELGGHLVVQSSKASGLTVKVRMPRANGGSKGAEQSLWFNNCQIHGDTEIRVLEPDTSNDAPLVGSCASNRVSGDFTFCGANAFQGLDISNLICGGAVRVVGAPLQQQSANDLDDLYKPPPATDAPTKLTELSLKNGRVEGMLLVGQCNAHMIELRNCRAGGNVKLQGLRIRDKLDASNMRVEGEFQVRGVVADALHRPAGPAGSEVAKADSHRPLPQLNFMGTRVGAALEFSDLDYQWTRNEHDLGLETTAFKSIKTRELSFYPGYKMVEAVTSDGAHTSYLWDGSGQPLHLNGTSPPIHTFNAHPGKRLTLDETTAADYLRFFCSAVWGEDGWFRIPFDENGLLRYSGDRIGQARALAARGAEIEITRDPEDDTSFLARKVPVIYAWHVFEADFKIMASGMVEMLDDDPLFALVGECPISFKNSYRRYNSQSPWERAKHLFRRITGNKRDPIDILPGEWTTLDNGQVEEFTTRLRTPDEAPRTSNTKTAEKPVGLRELGFYEGWSLVEAQSTDGEPWRRSYLWDGADEIVKLDGTSPPIHALNAKLGSRLVLTEETAADYLRFFCHSVWAEDGWFRFPESASELDRQEAGAPPDDKTRARAEAGLSFAINREQGADGTPVFVASGVTIIYGNAVFVTDFRITDTGQVEMTDDTPLYQFTGGAPLSFESGTGRRKAWVKDGTEIYWPMPGPWSDPPEELRQPFARFLAGLYPAGPEPSAAPHASRADQRPEGLPRVNLAFVECSYLNDAGGQAWRRPSRQAGKVGRQLFQLNLDNFRYELHNEDPETLGVSGDFDVASGASARQYNQWEARRDWLKLQYLDDRPKNADEFNVQPYEHIAQLFRRSGRAREAAEIIHDRMSIESGFTWKRWRENFSGARLNTGWIALLLAISLFAGLLNYYILGSDLWALIVIVAGAILVYCYPWWSDRLYRHLFYYGLSPLPPMVVFIGLILAGSLVTQYWQRNDVLIYDEMPVELRSDGHGTVAVAGGDGVSGLNSPNAVKPCGDQINVPLYAVDTFVPLIDLKQEMRCRPDPKYWYWQMAKSVYTALGWIVTSMLILAVSGLIRRRSEG